MVVSCGGGGGGGWVGGWGGDMIKSFSGPVSLGYSQMFLTLFSLSFFSLFRRDRKARGNWSWIISLLPCGISLW